MPMVARKIAVIGAGLSGLATADLLLRHGYDVVVLEARDRVGGRILSRRSPSVDGHRYDLGPAWVWPHNHRALSMLGRLGLRVMPQHARGNLVFQDERGSVRRDLTFSTMEGALRVEGGLARLPEALADGLPKETLALEHRVVELRATATGLSIIADAVDGSVSFDVDRAVLALPPRLWGERLAFDPPLPPRLPSTLAGVPTWMAGHAKAVAVYPTAFWRKAGLSGDAISRRGPLFEIHDASPDADATGEAALFGFVHPGAIPGSLTDGRFQDQVIAQLSALFGPQAAQPSHVDVKVWGDDPYTAVASDRPDLAGHPTYRPISIDDAPWRDRLFVAGSETANENGGFLEGAIEAAEAACQWVRRAQ